MHGGQRPGRTLAPVVRCDGSDAGGTQQPERVVGQVDRDREQQAGLVATEGAEVVAGAGTGTGRVRRHGAAQVRRLTVGVVRLRVVRLGVVLLRGGDGAGRATGQVVQRAGRAGGAAGRGARAGRGVRGCAGRGVRGCAGTGAGGVAAAAGAGAVATVAGTTAGAGAVATAAGTATGAGAVATVAGTAAGAGAAAAGGVRATEQADRGTA